MLHHKKDASGSLLSRLFLYLRVTLQLGLYSSLCLAAASQPLWADTACSSQRYDETTSIRYIHDGDTLHLKDGRKVRLIGINTPEVAHGEKTAEPFSYQARDALRALFGDDNTISLIYGDERYDRYKRLLAHAFTADGENIQAKLLKQGLARAVTFPPNTRFSACYKQQERNARCARAGLWKNMPLLSAKYIADKDIGFQLVMGKLNHININRKGIWLKLDNRLTVGIRPGDQPQFDIDTIFALSDKNIVVRGWLNKSKKNTPYYMRIRHPSSIQPAEVFACD
ncbi:MAG: thermonuclease family protein [Gammaproteobacteria bacterium]|nr:thermonuclease family protein [Gammaproteobacteria bacterium]NNJ49452.1 thermonuclease family protein [Gammaproteobacteria bacterium]